MSRRADVDVETLVYPCIIQVVYYLLVYVIIIIIIIIDTSICKNMILRCDNSSSHRRSNYAFRRYSTIIQIEWSKYE